MNKKSNMLVGAVVIGLVLLGAGWWAFSGVSGKSKPETSGNSGVAKPSSGVSKVSEQGTSTSSSGAGAFVASKNGTKYFPLDCGSAKTIKEENKIFFGSAAEAESAGYEAAKNCGN